MRYRTGAFGPISFEPLDTRLSLSTATLPASAPAFCPSVPTLTAAAVPAAPPYLVDDPPITQPELPPSGPVGPGTSS